jgi:hypothetical protein
MPNDLLGLGDPGQMRASGTELLARPTILGPPGDP